jgi:hypothetical protein
MLSVAFVLAGDGSIIRRAVRARFGRRRNVNGAADGSWRRALVAASFERVCAAPGSVRPDEAIEIHQRRWTVVHIDRHLHFAIGVKDEAIGEASQVRLVCFMETIQVCLVRSIAVDARWAYAQTALDCRERTLPPEPIRAACLRVNVAAYQTGTRRGYILASPNASHACVAKHAPTILSRGQHLPIMQDWAFTGAVSIRCVGRLAVSTPCVSCQQDAAVRRAARLKEHTRLEVIFVIEII